MPKIIDQLIKFREDRGWGKHHTPDNLAQALNIEAAELQELFLWGKEPDTEKIAEELADVLIYALYMVDRYGFCMAGIIENKMAKNAIKYPVEINQEAERGWK